MRDMRERDALIEEQRKKEARGNNDEPGAIERDEGYETRPHSEERGLTLLPGELSVAPHAKVIPDRSAFGNLHAANGQFKITSISGNQTLSNVSNNISNNNSGNTSNVIVTNSNNDFSLRTSSGKSSLLAA